MVIFAVIFAIFFREIKKNGNSYFFRNLHLLSFPTIYSLPYFPLKWRTYEFFPGGHGKTPAKVRGEKQEVVIRVFLSLALCGCSHPQVQYAWIFN